MELLINVGADIHVEEEYALMKYCLCNNIDVVKLLVDAGANVYARDCMCLVQAAGNGFKSIVQVVCDHMEKIQINLGTVIMSNFDLALISAVTYSHGECVQLLMKKGADISINNYEIIMATIVRENIDIMKIFLNGGLDPNVCDGAILKKAIKGGNYDLVKTIVEFEVDGKYLCDLSMDNCVYLRWATIDGNDRIVKLLLDSVDKCGNKRCDIAALDYDVYRLAKKYNHPNMIDILNTYKE